MTTTAGGGQPRSETIWSRSTRGGGTGSATRKSTSRKKVADPHRLLQRIQQSEGDCYATGGSHLRAGVSPFLAKCWAPVKLHVHARFFRFARKFNSDLCIAAPYVQVRTKRRLRCPDQPDPRHDPNPNPNPNPTLWGALGLLSRSAGAVLSLRAILKTLHVRTIIRLVQNVTARCLRLCYFRWNREKGGRWTAPAGSNKGMPWGRRCSACRSCRC